MAGKPAKKPARKKVAKKKASRKSAGRPSILTPELQGKIVAYLKAGAYIETAAAGVGISKRTLHLWLEKGRADKPLALYKQFVDAVDIAMAQDELRGAIHLSTLGAATMPKQFTCEKCAHENTVQVAVPGNVQLEATKWRLQHKYPSRYGAKIKLEHSADEAAVTAAYSKIHGAAEAKRARDKAEAKGR